MTKKATIGVLGASGYTGAELVRLLLRHPRVEIVPAHGRPPGRAGDARSLPAVLALSSCRSLSSLEGIDWAAAKLDLAFCALPHGTTQNVIKKLLADAPQTKVVDLSADFRLADSHAYARWYGHAHQAPELQGEAVYGLSEQSTGATSRRRGWSPIPAATRRLRRTAAHSAAQGESDRARRNRRRRQVGHDRRGQGGQGSDAVLGSVGRLQRLWRRQTPAHGRARSGILARPPAARWW